MPTKEFFFVDFHNDIGIGRKVGIGNTFTYEKLIFSWDLPIELKKILEETRGMENNFVNSRATTQLQS